ncbi:MAG: hypothetical protein HY814_10835 [Candidatus Riflebacteria bacterium]|nr:hypothetical protein [Candidatus Riflebacteria bacterium]
MDPGTRGSALRPRQARIAPDREPDQARDVTVAGQFLEYDRRKPESELALRESFHAAEEVVHEALECRVEAGIVDPLPRLES